MAGLARGRPPEHVAEIFTLLGVQGSVGKTADLRLEVLRSTSRAQSTSVSFTMLCARIAELRDRAARSGAAQIARPCLHETTALLGGFRSVGRLSRCLSSPVSACARAASATSREMFVCSLAKSLNELRNPCTVTPVPRMELQQLSHCVDRQRAPSLGGREHKIAGSRRNVAASGARRRDRLGQRDVRFQPWCQGQQGRPRPWR